MFWWVRGKRREYKIGDLLLPKNLQSLPLLAFNQREFVAPKTIDLRDYCLKTPNQEDRPWCAAYSACAFASNILWRKTDKPIELDPKPIYEYAKRIDGMPQQDGTTLVAAMEGLFEARYFDKSICKIATLRTIDQVRYAIHKFGCCLLGLQISKEWYDCSIKKSTISGKKNPELIGGHAVLGCGFTRKGVIIQNPWGVEWGEYGFALIEWEELAREFSYGSVIDNCLYDIKMN